MPSRVRPAALHTLVASLLVVLLSTSTAGPAAAAPLPSEKHWRHDVRHAMKGSRSYLDSVVESGDVTPAVVLDIDNTSLATHYRPGSPVLPVRAFARRAVRDGYAVLFDTGRLAGHLSQARRLLKRAHFPITAMCGRKKGETLAHSKPRCRERFVAKGYSIIANVGNNDTDFSGASDFDRAFRLPNYRGRLG